jgi:hypothetical protein
MKRERDETDQGHKIEETEGTPESKKTKQTKRPLYKILENGRVQIPFGVHFVQIADGDNEDEKKKECTCSLEGEEDEEDSDVERECWCRANDDQEEPWDYDVCGRRELAWSKLTEKDKEQLKKGVMQLIGYFFEMELNPEFSHYMGESIILECDMLEQEKLHMNKEEKEKKTIDRTIADCVGLVKFLSFKKGEQSELPDFKGTIEMRAWAARI